MPDTTQDEILTAYEELSKAGVIIPNSFRPHKVVAAKVVDRMEGNLRLPLSDPKTEHCLGAPAGAFATANFSPIAGEF